MACSGAMYRGVPISTSSCVCSVCEPHQLRDAEVQQLHPLDEHAVGFRGHQEDVGGLQVAVHHARAVGRLQRRAHLPGHGERLAQGHPALAQPVRQALAAQVLHDEVRRAVFQAVEVHHLDDVGVAQLRGDLRLAAEARVLLLAQVVAVQQHLHRHLLARQPQVPRQEDRAHAPLPEQRRQFIRVPQDGADLDVGFGGVAHGGGGNTWEAHLSRFPRDVPDPFHAGARPPPRRFPGRRQPAIVRNL